MPEHLIDAYTANTNITAYCKQLLTQLSPAHYNTFIYIISFLRELLKHSTVNHCSDDIFTIIFSSSLLQADIEAALEAQNNSFANNYNNSSSSSSSAAAASASASAAIIHSQSGDKPKAWIIIKHFLTSEDFI